MNITGSQEIIEKISKKNNVSVEAVMALLDLENQHKDLHVWGARPALKRAIRLIVDPELKISL